MRFRAEFPFFPSAITFVQTIRRRAMLSYYMNETKSFTGASLKTAGDQIQCWSERKTPRPSSIEMVLAHIYMYLQAAVASSLSNSFRRLHNRRPCNFRRKKTESSVALYFVMQSFPTWGLPEIVSKIGFNFCLIFMLT